MTSAAVVQQGAAFTLDAADFQAILQRNAGFRSTVAPHEQPLLAMPQQSAACDLSGGEILPLTQECLAQRRVAQRDFHRRPRAAAGWNYQIQPGLHLHYERGRSGRDRLRVLRGLSKRIIGGC